jgi:cell division protein FtsN
MNFLKWFAYSIAFCAFVWFVFFRPLTSNSTSELARADADTTENVDQPTEDNSTIEDVENTDSYTEIEEIEETFAKTEPETNGSINLNSSYLIIVGSFGKKSNADRMLQRVKDSGKEGVITNIRGLHRVVTASSDDHSDAKALRAHFTHIYKERAFILAQ